ncbi:hypothetical protein [Micavibrio aeruginosavorus]|uniref:bestrophin-like domain n=1 Tax=Micavibrio aeruginosavorus TaxID=349221 RepID=UPI003F4AB139
MIWNTSEIVILPILTVVFIALIEGGFRLGGRRSSNHVPDAALSSHVDTLKSALLGLLALLLGFTFAMAVSRYDVRKELVVQEANAIGTAYLRAQYLPDAMAHDVQDHLRSFVDARLEFYNAGIDPDRITTANAAAADIEKKLWAQAIAVARTMPESEPASLFIESLNDVIDTREKRQAALDNHVPESVIALLFFVSAVGMGFIGYGCGLAGKRRPISTALFGLLIVVVLLVILDIDRPRRGLTEVSQASLLRLQDDLKKDGS